MPKVISKLIDFAYLPKNRPYLEQALSTYFEPIYEVTDTNDQHELVRVLGQQVFEQLYTCAMEFFFSNDYDEEDGGYWNLIDRFIAAKPLGLTEEDQQYLKGSRRSLMSVYEVLEVIPEQSITVRDLVRGGKPVVVREKAATRQLVKWDKMALRVVDMGDHHMIAGGGLPLDNMAAGYALEGIENHEAIADFVPMLTGETMDDNFFKHIRQSLWAVEIGEAYVTALLERREASLNAAPPILHNTEGHRITECELAFPLQGNKQDIIARIAGIPDVEEDDPRKGKRVWVWLSWQEPTGKGKPRRYTIRGRFILDKEALRIEANSTERAEMLEALVQEHVGKLVGKAEWKTTSQESLLKQVQRGKSKKQTKLRPVEDQELIASLTHDHYQQWLDMKISALSNKTPRQAASSKAGRKKLVELLKQMENREQHQSRTTGQNPYDFGWLWKELGIADALEAA